MTTRRGEAHHSMVRYEKNAKNALKSSSDPLAQGFYAFCAATARHRYVAKWKETKKHAGNGQHSR